MANKEQIRTQSDAMQNSRENSALSMSRETEQRLIREFQSPFPSTEERGKESVLLSNACWRDARL